MQEEHKQAVAASDTKFAALERERRKRIAVSCNALRDMLPKFSRRRNDMVAILEMTTVYLELVQKLLPVDLHDTVIRKWLGQLIDALVYLHKQNIIHRNLKPSNILLMPDQSFAIFDFNVACLADDEQKLKVRMKEIKSILCSIVNHYNTFEPDNQNQAQASSRCPLILFKHFRDLVYVPYVKECLLVCGSPLSGLKKRLPFGITGAPCEEGQQAVLEFMQKYFDVEEAQISGLRFFLEADQAAFAVTSQFKDMLMSLMKNHADSPEVHLEACRVLYQLSVAALERGLEKELLHSPEVISCILKAIRSYSTEIELLILALNICMILSENGNITEGQYEKITSLLLDAIKNHLSRQAAVKNACSALASLVSASGDLAMELAAQKFKTMLNEIKEKFASNKEIIDLAEAAALKMQE
ncbi:STKL1 protein, partial [Polypterus senegalus]